MEEGLFRPVLLAWASVQAEVLGRKECRRHGIGALIRKLRYGLPANDGNHFQVEQRKAAELLESSCRACGKCSHEEILRDT